MAGSSLKKNQNKDHASNVSSGVAAGKMDVEEEEEQGFVILETNYRVYAYTGKRNISPPLSIE